MRKIMIAVLTVLAACGQNAAPAPSAPQAENAQAIIDRLPLIDACLALAPDRRVVTVDPQSETSLRLAGDAGELDCVFPQDAVRPESAVIVPALNDVSTDAILFVRAPGENPGGECYQAPEVRNAEGELLGWTLDPEGC